MSSHRLGLIFLITISLIAIGYSGKVFYQTYGYLQLTQTADVLIIKWEPEELFGDRFAPKAHYDFLFKGKLYSGQERLLDSIYRSEAAIKEITPLLNNKKWKVWFNPAYPNNSILQKKFPLKECIYAVILCGIMFYFFGLAYYVSKFK